MGFTVPILARHSDWFLGSAPGNLGRTAARAASRSPPIAAEIVALLKWSAGPVVIIQMDLPAHEAIWWKHVEGIPAYLKDRMCAVASS
jgi:hypothetical protein